MFLLVIFALCVLVVGLRRQDNSEPLRKEQTTAINGFFVLIVFIDHFVQCVSRMGYAPSGLADSAYSIFRSNLAQLHVVSFLCFSGYGIMESIKKNGLMYIYELPRRRLLTVWANFAVGVLVIAVIQVLMGNGQPFLKVLSALSGWVQIGNPSWFIFHILWCYAAVYVSFRLSNLLGSRMWWLVFGVLGVLLLCLAYIALLLVLRPEKIWWYNTALVFPFGMMLSITKQSWVRLFHRHYFKVLAGVIVIFLFAMQYKGILCGLGHNVYSFCFVILLILLSMKFSIKNIWLTWLGRNIFPIYMYQFVYFLICERLLEGALLSKIWVLIIFSICLALTCITTRLYKYWQVKF